jgi:hypothetical protein
VNLNSATESELEFSGRHDVHTAASLQDERQPTGKPGPNLTKTRQRYHIFVCTVRRFPDVPGCQKKAPSHTEDELFRLGGSVLALIGLVLLVMWLLGFVAFHVTSGVIHVLLVLALISIIVHFLRGRTVA